ncbi:GNAT family N-acetyltransferase [Paenibacillus sp. N3.4]|uniref:GNAT family N-acetyltransferase n=1 Tax=Paenibacillus sp. N3.4 TaxID=2603222 RepID=UPI0011C9E113|nr:GNAT family N-acetyltransferase [Paenibacillus sp. N3.4]TXK80670.1 GNAT family N-acetyltransferase [Paenibacillus sp. N3.4]
MKLIKQKELSVRLITEEDATLLVKWLSDSKVLEYYGGRDRPHDLEMVKKHYFERTQEITQCIIQYNEEDIGYIQFYLITKEEKQEYGYEGFAGKIFGMDQFIGEVNLWNKGIGTELIKSMINHLETQERADKIVMDPQAWNKRALRVYEKCGFVKKKYLTKHEWHEGEYKDCWVIEYVGHKNH